MESIEARDAVASKDKLASEEMLRSAKAVVSAAGDTSSTEKEFEWESDADSGSCVRSAMYSCCMVCIPSGDHGRHG